MEEEGDKTAILAANPQDQQYGTTHSQTQLNQDEIGDITETEGTPRMVKKNELISDNVTLFHLIKGNIGIGVLAMPSALVNAGTLVGTVGLSLIAVLTIHCMHLLVNATDVLTKRHQAGFLDYGQVAEMSVYPHSKKLSRIANWTINIFVCITQIGGNSVYVLFISKSAQQFFNSQYDLNWDFRVYVAMFLVPVLVLCMIRNLRLLAPVTVVATICELYALGAVFYYVFRDPLPSVSSRPAYVGLDKLPLFFGTAIFTFEGIGIVLPLENRMKEPQRLLGLSGVLNTGMVIVACTYVATGFYGYLKYGEAASVGAVTLNLPQDEVVANSARIAITLAIFLTYPLQFYVIISIIVPNLVAPRVAETNLIYYEYLVRVLGVLLSFSLASTIPYLDLFISLAGAICMSTLSLISPAFIDSATHWEDISWIRLGKNVFIMLFGILGTVTGSILSVIQIVNRVKEDG